MTVICAQISSECTIHAADSLLTQSADDGTVKPIKSDHPKIILLPQFKGAISYWGKVKHEPKGDEGNNEDWDALEWIVKNANPSSFASSETENFCHALADTMSYYLADVLMNIERGIGLHFTAYEDIDGVMIPELFLITNYTGFTNTGGYPAGPRIISQRQTYFTMTGDLNFKEHHKAEFRKQVQAVLTEKEGYFTYNNGHVLQFCTTAQAVDKTTVTLRERPLKIVQAMISEQQSRPENQRRIGAPSYEVVIDPQGNYSSATHSVAKLPAAK